jgi:hypothetical protein
MGASKSESPACSVAMGAFEDVSIQASINREREVGLRQVSVPCEVVLIAIKRRGENPC